MAVNEIYELTELFDAVQMNRILEDGKTFVDCIPVLSLQEIDLQYQQQKDRPGFDLKRFVIDHFRMPAVFGAAYESDKGKPVEENIRQLWDVLTRQPFSESSSLINLPFTYVVPGGRFREIYYWDSYFTMLGLRQHNRIDLIESMINNFAFLIRSYGHIPNGNRRYYLSRSQPPFFALMVTLLADIKQDPAVYLQYKTELEQEHAFWQDGHQNLAPGEAKYRVVKMPGGELLNRYYDNNPQPRQESYAEDIQISRHSKQLPETLFTHMRAGAESGWDFSSRWLGDGHDIGSIRTTDIVPVDLNCLLYVLEKTIARANTLASNNQLAIAFEQKATARAQAILHYCWNGTAQFFCDYALTGQSKLGHITAAGLFPLFVQIATAEQAKHVAGVTKQVLLKPGGLVTTATNTGQQWDAPNGWAPLQWIACTGLKNYELNALADGIAERWIALNEKVFRETGKLMEKYNVEDLDKPAGGGEYPGQDGFGWTNGIYVALKHQMQ